MCGISGIIKNYISENDINDVVKMNHILTHRGPDFRKVTHNKNYVFGHTRLAILDLSENANQPMRSKNQRYTIVYNGEIYNHKDIKKKLKLENKFNCLGHSDTEILLNSIEAWGLKNLVIYLWHVCICSERSKK